MNSIYCIIYVFKTFFYNVIILRIITVFFVAGTGGRRGAHNGFFFTGPRGSFRRSSISFAPLTPISGTERRGLVMHSCDLASFVYSNEACCLMKRVVCLYSVGVTKYRKILFYPYYGI